MIKPSHHVMLQRLIPVLKGLQIIRFSVIMATLILCSCKEQQPLFLGRSVGKPLPNTGVEQRIAELLPSSVATVCVFGPYTDTLPETVSNDYRKAIEELQIFPVSEIEGYFVYLNEDASVMGVDRISYRDTGYGIASAGSQRDHFYCRPVDNLHVGVRSTITEIICIWLKCKREN